MPAHRKATAVQRRRMVSMYQRGKSLRIIATKFDLSHEGVRKIIHQAGVQTRARGGVR